jgi:DNA helicase-2/ATP-dependent DNA helicase PcrA
MSDLLDPPHSSAGADDSLGLSNFRRLAVYETPGVDELLARLAELAPEAQFVPTEAVSPPLRGSGIPVWHWDESIEEFAAEAGSRLRELVYPMLVDDRPCCFSFAFARSELQPRALDPARLSVLDLENIGRLLALDVVEERFSLLPELAGRLALTPIEERLQRAMQRADIDAKPQVKFDRFRLDFLVEVGDRRVAVEADGRDFHDAVRDARRDEKLRRLGIEEVLRFTGSEIWLDADACAARVTAYLGEGHSRGLRIRRQSLDDSQLNAVGHGGGAARVLAPAGAGKTRVLVNRIAELIDRGVEPQSILALAFNTKANDQLVGRLTDLHVPVSPAKVFDPSNSGVVCATFNAFGFRYQRELLSLTHRLETSQEVWRELMAQAIRRSGESLKGTKRGSDPLGEFLRALDRVRQDLADPEEILVELDTFDQAGSRVVPFAPVYAAYQRLRLDGGTLGFDDQLHVAVLDLLANPRNRELIQSRFRHVLVDEYQDLNAAQLALVDIVSSPWRNLYVVGDDDQLIYGWRFANLTNILGFHERMPAKPYSATYVLSTNYRSSCAIVESSRRVIDHNQERETKDIQPAPDAAAGEVRYVSSDSWRDRTTEIVRFLKEHKTPRSHYRDLAVLCRYKAQQPFVAFALDHAGIPRSPLLTYRLFSDRQMQLLRAYIELVRHPKGIDGASLRLLLNKPERYLTNELVDELCTGSQPWLVLTSKLTDPACPPNLRDLSTRVLKLNEECKLNLPSSSTLLENTLLAFELESFWRDARIPGAASKDEADTLQLLGLIRLHAEGLDNATKFLEFWDTSAERERARFDTAADNLARETNPEEDAVVIGTMHSSKGREYDAVVLYDYDAELANLSLKHVEEERRVFYVGLTRARHSALITIDGNAKRLPLFVRESIEPRQPDEETTIDTRLRSLQESEGDIVVARVRHQRELDAIATGAELDRCRNSLASARAESLPLEEELEQLTPLLERPSVWEKLRGHAAKARGRAGKLSEKIEALRDQCDRLEHRIDLLETEPGLVAAPLHEQLRRAEDQLATVREQQLTLRSRLGQLQLLAAADTTDARAATSDVPF